eukprot:5089184-Amphidinium_carterae.1
MEDCKNKLSRKVETVIVLRDIERAAHDDVEGRTLDSSSKELYKPIESKSYTSIQSINCLIRLWSLLSSLLHPACSALDGERCWKAASELHDAPHPQGRFQSAPDRTPALRPPLTPQNPSNPQKIENGSNKTPFDL